MQNYSLLKTHSKSTKPVLLKRGPSATVEELLLASEYLLDGGNENVVLCERGIRTYETSTRNTLDLNAVAVMRDRTHLPVIVDPSHGTGVRKFVTPLARAGVAAGAQGVIVEVHHEPDKALSDGAQSLLPEQFEQLTLQVNALFETLQSFHVTL
jgi:3-deoxy-7-phosphoheptulonate synthase